MEKKDSSILLKLQKINIYKKNNYKLTILPVNGKSSVMPQKRDYVIRFKNTKLT